MLLITGIKKTLKKKLHHSFTLPLQLGCHVDFMTDHI